MSCAPVSMSAAAGSRSGRRTWVRRSPAVSPGSMPRATIPRRTSCCSSSSSSSSRSHEILRTGVPRRKRVTRGSDIQPATAWSGSRVDQTSMSAQTGKRLSTGLKDGRTGYTARVSSSAPAMDLCARTCHGAVADQRCTASVESLAALHSGMYACRMSHCCDSTRPPSRSKTLTVWLMASGTRRRPAPMPTSPTVKSPLISPGPEPLRLMRRRKEPSQRELPNLGRLPVEDGDRPVVQQLYARPPPRRASRGDLPGRRGSGCTPPDGRDARRLPAARGARVPRRRCPGRWARGRGPRERTRR